MPTAQSRSNVIDARRQVELSRELEKKNLAERLNQVRQTNGWRDIQEILELDFCEGLDELINENDVSKAFVIKSDLKATLRLASKIGAAINVGEHAKETLQKRLNGK